MLSFSKIDIDTIRELKMNGVNLTFHVYLANTTFMCVLISVKRFKKLYAESHEVFFVYKKVGHSMVIWL